MRPHAPRHRRAEHFADLGRQRSQCQVKSGDNVGCATAETGSRTAGYVRLMTVFAPGVVVTDALHSMLDLESGIPLRSQGLLEWPHVNKHSQIKVIDLPETSLVMLVQS